MKVVVLGSGVFGLSAAHELARRGYHVTLIEQGPVPNPSASSVDLNRIIRADYGQDAFYFDLADKAMQRWEIVNRKWPSEVFHPVGLLVTSLTATLEEGSFIAESMKLIEKNNKRSVLCDSTFLKTNFPAWDHNVYPLGYVNPAAGYAESGRAIEYLANDCRSMGVTIRDHTRLAHICYNPDGSLVTGVTVQSGEVIPCDRLVVAGGSWTPTIIPDLQDCMWAAGQPVIYLRPKPEKAHLFAADKFPVFCADIAKTGFYGFPLKDGVVKIGNHGVGRRVHPDDNRSLTADELQRFKEFIETSLPDLADAEIVKSGLCFYCDTWDGNFYIDYHPRCFNLMVASGGSGHGFKFLPVIGSIIADVMERRPNPYAHRFQWRSKGTAVKSTAERCMSVVAYTTPILPRSKL